MVSISWRRSPALPYPGAALTWAWDMVLRWQDRARERHYLAMLDDHMLRDMGISRADAEQESAKSFWRE